MSVDPFEAIQADFRLSRSDMVTRLDNGYRQFDAVAHEVFGNRHSVDELIVVEMLGDKLDIQTIYYEQRQPDWMLVQTHGQSRSLTFDYYQGNMRCHTLKSRRNELSTEEAMLVMSGLIEHGLTALRTRRATVRVR